jgi:hypothetical protein
MGSGAINMSGGSVDNNDNSSPAAYCTLGAGINVNGGTFTMTGGVIRDNSTNSMGGGVQIEGGSFIMSGGEIANNRVYYSGQFVASNSVGGGGIQARINSRFEMRGGRVVNNSVSGISGVHSAGGGILIQNYGAAASYPIVDIYGGEISGNSAPLPGSYGGGGLYMAGGTLTFHSGGTVAIQDNTTGSSSYAASFNLRRASGALTSNGMIPPNGTPGSGFVW